MAEPGQGPLLAFFDNKADRTGTDQGSCFISEKRQSVKLSFDNCFMALRPLAGASALPGITGHISCDPHN